MLVTNVQLTGNVNSTEDRADEKTADTNKPGEAPTSQLLVTLALDARLGRATRLQPASSGTSGSRSSRRTPTTAGTQIVTRDSVLR